MERKTDRCSGTSRPLCVPPGMLHASGETLEGGRILSEANGDLGFLLWRTVRDVTLWAGTPAGQRGDLFADGCGEGRLALLAGMDLPAAITGPIDTLHGMMALSSRADAETVAVCCIEVAAWASRAGMPHTAVAFAQAGALAAPAFGAAALQVGVFARAAGQSARAETWLRRAVAVSRREGDRVAYSVALVELGELYECRGNADRSESLFRLAYRAALRYAARGPRMRAAHGLFRLMRRKGDEGGAAQFAFNAQLLYEPDAVGGPELLLDLARYWTDLREPGRARGALRRLAPPVPGQLAALSLTARARAENGNRDLARDAADAAWRMMRDEEIADDARFAAALDLAHAARITGDRVRFTRAKQAVLRLAPQADFPAIARTMAEVWPEGADLPIKRAS